MIRYSYPVIYPGTDCYDAELVKWSDLKYELIENHILVTGDYEIKDEVIANIIESGDAKICVLVSCPRTDYRELFDFEEQSFEINVEDVAGTVNIEQSIVAMKEIKCDDFSHLSEDYRGISAIIPRLGYIAKKDTSFFVDRELEPDSESICKFDKDSNATSVWYDEYSDYIHIKLPEKIHVMYQNLDAPLKKVYTAMYVAPILQQIIYDYWFKDGGSPQATIWYNVLDRVISDKYPKSDTDPTGLKDVSPFEVMNAVLESLIFAACDSIHECSIKMMESN